MGGTSTPRDRLPTAEGAFAERVAPLLGPVERRLDRVVAHRVAERVGPGRPSAARSPSRTFRLPLRAPVSRGAPGDGPRSRGPTGARPLPRP